MNHYRAAMSMAKSMLERGLISEKEYYKIDRIMAKKYGVDLSNICLRNPLIYKEYRVNMPPDEER